MKRNMNVSLKRMEGAGGYAAPTLHESLIPLRKVLCLSYDYSTASENEEWEIQDEFDW